MLHINQNQKYDINILHHYIGFWSAPYFILQSLLINWCFSDISIFFPLIPTSVTPSRYGFSKEIVECPGITSLCFEGLRLGWYWLIQYRYPVRIYQVNNLSYISTWQILSKASIKLCAICLPNVCLINTLHEIEHWRYVLAFHSTRMLVKKSVCMLLKVKFLFYFSIIT